jgi:hypothetical protein
MKYKGKIAHLCVSVLPATLKKLAALKQFLILNAFSTLVGRPLLITYLAAQINNSAGRASWSSI